MMAMRRIRIRTVRVAALATVLAVVGCGDDGGEPAVGEASSGTGTEGTESLGEDEGAEPSADGATEGETSAVESSGGADPSEDEGEVVCEIGEVRPCDCPDGMTGQEVCVDTDGTFSACGCPTDPDVYEEPEEPEPTFCGALECAPMLEEETEVSAKPCCTDDNMCGSEADFIFGNQCVERFGDPGDLETAECPDEFPHFLDLDGCCLPSGQCGLSIDYINNWDVGCIERTEMMELLNAGKAARAILAAIFLLGSVDVEYEAMSCTPG